MNRSFFICSVFLHLLVINCALTQHYIGGSVGIGKGSFVQFRRFGETGTTNFPSNSYLLSAHYTMAYDSIVNIRTELLNA